jgi:hypothetical protein
LHSRDLSLLLKIQKYFYNIGTINQRKNKEAILYSVYNIKDLTNIIIPHFENFPLSSQKAADFFLFKKIVEIISKKDHLTFDGLQKNY